MAPVNLAGTWKLDRTENLDEMMKTVGTGYVLRQFAKLARPINEIDQDEDKFVIRIRTALGDRILDFTVGDEWEEYLRAYKGMFKCVSRWEGNSLVIVESPVDGGKWTYINKRELVGNEYILTVTVDDIVCKRIFKRVK